MGSGRSGWGCARSSNPLRTPDRRRGSKMPPAVQRARVANGSTGRDSASDGTMTSELRSDSSIVRRLLAWTPAAVAAVIFVALSAYYRFHTGDDSFIYYRYVANVVAGHGPVWNPGEHPVEGYSSPLWLGMLSLGAGLGADVILWSRWLGILWSAVALIGVGVMASRMGAGVTVAGLAVLAASLIRGLYYWAPVGLETPLDTALLVWTCVFLVDARPTRAWMVPVALLGVARPEGPFLVVLALVAAVMARGRQAVSWREVAIVLAPALGWEVFRLAYYGAPLPNTYYAKATGHPYRQLRIGMRYGGWVVLPLVVAMAAWAARPSNRPALGVLVLIGIQLAFTIGGGGDWMTNHRLLLPMLLSLLGCAAAIAAPPEAVRGSIAAGAVAVLALMPMITSPRTIVAAFRGETLPLAGYQEGSLVPTSRTAATWIARHYPDGTVIAVNHAGVVPYELPGFTAIDMTGLNDEHIAHEVPGGLHQKFDPDYILAKHPRLILLNSHVEPGQDGIWYHRGYWEGETALVDRLEFKRWYRPVRYWTLIGPRGRASYILLFERTEEPMSLAGD